MVKLFTRVKDKLYLISLVIRSSSVAVIAIVGNRREVAHNMATQEIKESIKHLEETIHDNS